MAGVHGIAVEVWWGIVERFSPLAYDWSLYEELFKLISESGLKVHVALSFHSNVNSSSNRKGGVSLPLWIIEVCYFAIKLSIVQSTLLFNTLSIYVFGDKLKRQIKRE